MKTTARASTVIALMAAAALAACRPGDGTGSSAPAVNEEAPSAEELGAVSDAGNPANEPNQGKPTAPIDLRYNVIGTAFVGEPVNIEIDVSSTVRDRAIVLEYRINDPRELSFGEAQPERVSLSAIGDAPSATRQVTVVPRQEGRLYLNVSAEIETQEGSLIKAISIPVQVGAARGERPSNGERREDHEGEPVMSMPADENQPAN